MALPSEDVDKYELLTAEDIWLEKNLLENAASVKIFKYWPLSSELIKQTYIVGKRYQELITLYGFDENEVIKNAKIVKH